MRSVLFSAMMLGCVVGSAQADILYAVTRTQLLRVDTNNPGTIDVVGNHGLAVTSSGTKSHGSFGLTYDQSTNSLVGLHYEYDSLTGNFDQSLVSYDMTTGLGSVETYLGNSATDGYFEAIEYVGSQNSLVVSSGLTVADGTFTRALYALDNDGSRTFLSENGRDNDYAVYDSSRDIFFTIDPNGVGYLTAVGVQTGFNTDIGKITGGISALAYSESEDAIYSFDVWSQQLVRIDSFRGVEPLTLTDLGVVSSNDIVQGMAFVVPSPASLALLGAGVFVGFRRKR